MSKAISQDGTAIAYDRTGTGSPVILIGGALCDRAMHVPLANLLAGRHTVLNYDRRGRGDSGDNSPAGTFPADREIEDIAALIAEAGGSAALYGISSGGALALQAAAAGLQVTKVAAYEPPYVVEAAVSDQLESQGAAIPELIKQGRAEEALETFLGMVGTPPEAITGMKQTPAWPGMVAIAPTLPYDFAVMGDNSIPTGRFAAIGVPTLIANGGSGLEFMQSAAAVLAKTIPGARHAVLTGQAHDVSAEVLAPVLLDFLAD